MAESKLKVKKLNPQASDYYKRMMAMFEENTKLLKRMMSLRLRMKIFATIAGVEFIILVYVIIKLISTHIN